MSTIFITGNSQGPGPGLTRYLLEQQHELYSMSRSDCPIEQPYLQQRTQDLSQLQPIEQALSALLPDALDLVVLNAGMLDETRDLSDTPMQEVQQLMDVNVWANKIIIDWLIKNHIRVKQQLILISSGASVNGNRGWGIYSISRASINMMAKLYAHEMPGTYITAYAPGIIHTQMQD
jgi:NAD(P)-dependent dehydrogenase (short-subunit alcohol dehydrogenase family)